MEEIRMKKIIVLFLGVCMLISLVSCGKQDDASGTDTNATTQEGTENASGQETVDGAKDDASGSGENTGAGKTLVVYFSATGNTKEVADYIVAETGADTLELQPVDAYSSDDLNWRDDDSRVVYEHENPEARVMELVESTVSDWESYDTVFVGYPIWWGIAAWPVDAFIAANDFTGKTVIPFCTSSTSGLGESGELLEEAAGTGNWLEGMRFSSNASKETVQSWLDGLGVS